MDLLDKVKKVFSENLTVPIFDIHFDNRKKITGYIASEDFDDRTDEESQQLIWNILTKHFSQEELLNISVIFHETLKERIERLMGYSKKSQNINNSKYWFHITPEEKKYWIFLDVKKMGEQYKSFFLVFNQEEENFNECVTFVYDKDVIAFMELAEDEVESKLYNNVLNSAKVTIKVHLMKKYEELKEKEHLFGKYNIYNYVFNSFQITPAQKSDLIFISDKDVSLLEKQLDSIKDDFDIKEELRKVITLSKSLVA